MKAHFEFDARNISKTDATKGWKDIRKKRSQIFMFSGCMIGIKSASWRGPFESLLEINMGKKRKKK